MLLSALKYKIMSLNVLNYCYQQSPISLYVHGLGWLHLIYFDAVLIHQAEIQQSDRASANVCDNKNGYPTNNLQKFVGGKSE